MNRKTRFFLILVSGFLLITLISGSAFGASFGISSNAEWEDNSSSVENDVRITIDSGGLKLFGEDTVVYQSFDPGSPDDLTSNANDGSLTGSASIGSSYGKYGEGLNLPNDGYLDFGTSLDSLLSDDSQGTVLGWVKPHDGWLSGDKNAYFGGDINSNSDWFTFGVGRNGNKLRLLMQYGGTDEHDLTANPSEMTYGNWYLVAWTQDGSGAKMYWMDSSSDTLNLADSDSNSHWFSDYSGTLNTAHGALYWDGSTLGDLDADTDEFAVLDSALSENQIKRFWARTKPSEMTNSDLKVGTWGGIKWPDGGFDSKKQVDNLEFDISFTETTTDSSWENRRDLPEPRADTASAVKDNKIYVFGGYNDTASDEKSSTFVYNPSNNSWISKDNMPEERWGAFASRGGNDNIYIFGGTIGGSQQSNIWEFDPDATSGDQWRNLSVSCPYSAQGIGGQYVPSEGLIYLMGGFDGSNSHNDVWTFNPTTKNVDTSPSNMPINNYWMNIAFVNDNIYTMGGFADRNDATDNTYVYDVSADSWTQLSDMPAKREGLGRTNTYNENTKKIYVSHGKIDTTFYKDIYIYDPFTDTWEIGTDAPTTGDAHSTAVINGVYYALAGRNDSPGQGVKWIDAYTPNKSTYNPSENIYASIGVDTDNDSTVDENTGWNELSGSVWSSPSISDGYAFQIKFKLTTDNTSSSPSVDSYTLNVSTAVTNSAPTAENLISENLTSTSADLGLDASDPDGDDIDYVEIYDNSDDSLIDNLTTTKASPASYSTTWSGLSASTTYSWYAKAVDNQGGISSASSVDTFTTNAGNSAPTAENFSETNIDRTSADLSADVYDSDGDDLSWLAIVDDDTSTTLENKNSGPYPTPESISYSWTGLTENTTYNWKVVAQDNEGANSTSAVQSFTTDADNPPTASFTHDGPALTSETVNFDASGSSDDYSISSYEWDWTSDGSYEGSGETATHSYPDNGTYTVKLRVTDGSGQTDTATDTVTINNRSPTADFSYTMSVDTVDVDASASSDPDGSISTYKWDWTSDGSYEDTGQTASHTYTSGGSHNVTLKVTDDDGATDTIQKTVVSNYAPEIVSISVDNTLIDNHADTSRSSTDTNLTITVVLRDNDGRNEIDSARIAIRDNEDGIIENSSVLSEKVIKNENSIEVFLNYDAETNNLATPQLGSWDVWAYVKDNVGAENEEWSNGVFSVDEADVTLSLTPSDIGFAMGEEYEVSGNLSRVFGSISTGEGSLTDEETGSKSFSGTSYTENIEITAYPNTTVEVTASATIDSVLDAKNTTTYTVNENFALNVLFRWENDYILIDNIGDENVHLSFIFDNYTSELSVENNPENVVLKGGPNKATVLHDGTYTRSRIDFERGENVVFILVDDPSELGEYELSLKDWTGQYGFPGGYISLRKYYEDNLMIIDERYWDGEGHAFPYLKTSRDYFYRVVNKNTGEERTFPTTTFPSTLEKTISITSDTIENYEYFWEDVRIGVGRDSDNNIYVDYLDEDGLTDNVTIKIYELPDNVLVKEHVIHDDQDFLWTWDNAKPENNYIINLGVERRNHSFKELTFSVSYVLQEAIGSWWASLKENVVGGPEGVALATIGGIFIVTLVAVLFTRASPDLAMIAIAMTVTVLASAAIWINIDLLPYGAGTIIFFWALAVLRKVGEGI